MVTVVSQMSSGQDRHGVRIWQTHHIVSTQMLGTDGVIPTNSRMSIFSIQKNYVNVEL